MEVLLLGPKALKPWKGLGTRRKRRLGTLEGRILKRIWRKLLFLIDGGD